MATVNFGESQIMSKMLARNANLVIAEIDKNSIRVGGDNSMHISEIDYFVERTDRVARVINLPQPSEEESAKYRDGMRDGREGTHPRPRDDPDRRRLDVRDADASICTVIMSSGCRPR